MSDKEYFAHPFVSNSRLTAFNGGGGMPPESLQRVFDFGSLVHAGILQFERLNVIESTLDDKPVNPDDMAVALKMRTAFYKNELCTRIRMQSLVEYEIYRANTQFEFEGRRFALDTKRKYDMIDLVNETGADIKTTSAETREDFVKHIDHFDYDRARVFYAAGSNVQRDVIIGISKINFQIFIVPMVFNDYLWKRGTAKMNKLCHDYWLNNLPF
jgi:hypothetical protein